MGFFSVGKILVLVLILAVVWYGFKLVSRRNQNIGNSDLSGKIGQNGADPEDMEKCIKCNTYVPNAEARACGRDECPYPD